MSVRVQREDFDIGAEVRRLTAGRTDIGAIVTFTGTVRSDNDGAADHRHDARALSRHDREPSWRASRPKPATRWPLQASLIVHRVGALKPGDNIVLVVTASAHREAAFAAAEFLMDYLKTRAPFWKKEAGADGGALGRRPRQRRDAAERAVAGCVQDAQAASDRYGQRSVSASRRAAGLTTDAASSPIVAGRH